MSEQASYYFWKWADNDLPGKPTEVFAALMRGELHPALQTFDARPLLRRLEKLAASGRRRGEEWDWRAEDSESLETARFIHLTCPTIHRSEKSRWKFIREFLPLDVSGFDEQTGRVLDILPPKLNCLILGQYPDIAYDIQTEDLPVLLRRIDPNEPAEYAWLVNRQNSSVCCQAYKRRFSVEWLESCYPADWSKFKQWRADYPRSNKTVVRMYEPSGRGYNRYTGEEWAVHYTRAKEHPLLRFSDTAQIFGAFLRGEPRPRQYHWRDITKDSR
ncbi:MAG: hypothetical protein NTY01_07925 [Verrucomicrobia bacterium]|nr:hypothetical protein [Verrucomicrobiota bacterium]